MTRTAGTSDHWDEAYRQGEATRSWFQPSATPSLRMLDAAGVEPDDGVIDVGGGTARLVDALLARGYHDLTVLDISAEALRAAQRRLGAQAERVDWLVEDLLRWQPARTWAVWHDRALLHFFTDAADRTRYVDRLNRATRPGSVAVLATFAPDGPEQCSGLAVARADATQLAELLGTGWTMITDLREVHTTPSGVPQPFTWAAFRRSGAGVDELLAQARARLVRLSPAEALEAQRQGAILIDTRPQASREAEGELPGAVVVERTVLEWRLDPASPDRLPFAAYDLHVVVVCNEGYSSSLAAASLQDLGLSRATDLDGGFRAWKAAGLPTVP